MLQRYFEEQAARSPRALAVAAGEERLTYGELEARANRLARHLRRLGVGPEVRVGLCVERRASMVTALLGILKAGGAYVALDPAYPRERVAWMIEDSGAEILLAEPGTLGSLPAGDRRLVLLGEETEESPEPLATAIDPENLSYLVYTSGSTGRPKGVALTHRSAAALVDWALETFTPGELAGVLAGTSLCFDLSVFEVFAPLSAGGTVIVAANALELPGLPADPPVTLLNTVPSAGAELLRARGIPPSVKIACFAGEALPAALADGVYRTTSVSRVFNLYGPSEDTVYSTAALVEPGSPAPPIGRPLAGTQAYLDDEGELFLGGVGLARGYLGRPDVTAERFVPDPWSGEPGARLYRTGDLVRRLPDGELLFLGRADHQVKLRGFRIELGEIDAALLRHPAVREAVTVARRDRLVSYVVLEEPASAAALRSFLGRSLPDPMIPAVFLRLDALPRTLNGKVDRKALPETAEPLPEEGGEGVSAVARVLSVLWAEALRVERVEPHEDLYGLGARAPEAAWVLARVRDLLGVELPERALSSAPTVAGLARFIESRLPAEPEPPLAAVPRGGPLPLMPAQHRLWFVERLHPGEPTYNEPAALDLRGPLSVPRLAAALSELVRRHEAFRCIYGERGGEPFQEPVAPAPVPLPVTDLGGPSLLLETELERLVDLEVRRPFDLGRPPLLRGLLVRLAPERHVLVLNVPHIAYDASSRTILFDELDALYAGRPLPPPGLQPADVADWERRAWRGAPAEPLALFLGRLADSEPLELPADRPRPAAPSSAGATLRFTVPPFQVGRLRALARQEGTTLFRVLLGLFSALLGRHAGREAGTVGITAATRPPGVGTSGFFINLLPIAMDLAGRPSLRGLLAGSRETVEAALALRRLHYQKLAALRPDGDLFRVLFQMTRLAPPRLEGLEVRWRPVDTGTAKFDLETTLMDLGGALEGGCQYPTDLYDPATVAAFAAGFLALLEGIDPEVPLEDHPALREAELRQALAPREGRPDRPDRQYRRDRRPAAGGSARPATPTEELIAQIWTEVLGVESVGRRDNFFHLGGHSLLAARVLARIQEMLGPQLPLRALFRAPTVETLAEAVLAAAGKEETAGTPPEPLLASPGPGPHPVSFGQQGLWLVNLLEPDGPLYILPYAYRLRGALDRRALSWSVRETARRHEVLRSRFVEVEGRLLQEVAVADLDVLWIDLSALPSPEPELERLLREEAAARFDLARGPLARARLIILEEEDHLLQVTAHHTAFDGWSQEVMEREISALYRGEDPPAPALRYSDFARWQRDRLQGETLERLLAFWRAELAGAPAVLELATDRPRPAVRRARRASVRRPLPSGLAAQAQALCRAEGVTPFMLYLAVFQAQLHRATGQDDVLVGAPVSSRHRIELEGLIGLFVDTVVLRGRFGGEPTFRELLARTRETALSAFVHQDLPLELLVADLRPERGVSHNPLFQVMFALKNAPPESLDLGLRSVPLDPGASTAMFDLTLMAEERAFELECDTDLFDVATAESLLDGFLALLENAVADPARRISAAKAPGAIGLSMGSREPTHGRRSRRPGSGRPATPTEELIAQIWAEVLEMESVGRRENFFQLGGHSLLAARVLTRIQEMLGPRLPLRALFQAPTVETLAETVLAAEGIGTRPEPLHAGPDPGPHPASFGQQGLWLVDRLEADGPLYNLPYAYRLRGALDRRALSRSVRETARRHEVLRSRFVEVEGRLLQESAVADLDVPWIDLSGLPASEPELERLLGEEAAARFDLSRGPLARARLLILGEEEHVLQVTAHHTAFDGWSQEVLEREISVLYRGEDPPPLPVRYSDFARWQRDRLQGETLDRLLAFWRAELAGAPAVLELATDRPRPAVRRARGASVRRPLPSGLAARAQALCRAEGVTPFMLYLAVFQAQLHRATGQDDVLVGAPVSSRHRMELEELIGLFVDTVVLRGRFGGAAGTFRELLARTRETALSAFAHQDLPLERLVAELGLERNAAHNPLFQVMFALEGTPPAGLDLGLRSALLASGSNTAMFDLTLTAQERAFELEYDTDLFDAATAESLLDGFLAFLENAVADPGQRISEITLVSAAVPLPASSRGGIPVHDLISLQAAKAPDSIALSLGSRELTYGELEARSDALAERLRGLGVGPESIVGVHAERSPELVVAVLAVWKAGGVYLPLDPALPRERLAHLIADSRIGVLLSPERLEPLDSVPAAPGESLPESLAYVLYTSGSTGGPKPVGVSHAALAEHVLAAVDFLELTAEDRVLFFASPAFDVSLEELLPPLVRGATVVLRGPDLWPPADFSRIAEGLGLTVADLPTAYWRQWIREVPPAPRGLRLVSAGGEAMPPEEARLWLQSPLGGVRLLNAYGPTEGVITATVLEVSAASVARPRAVSLGRPLPGRRACVVDLYGQLQPVGVAGELCLGGVLARGYLGRPDLTARRFVPDPWSPEPGGRLYRTGDLARLLPDGTLEYLGRLDRQLKVRGIRIEPGEIEAALLLHPDVQEAAVDLRPGPSGEPMLVAWIAGTAADLQSHLRGLLPEALIPAAFVPVPALPLTIAGKVDRRALPSPEAPAVTGGAFRTPTEERLAAIWAEVLGIEQIGPDDSFFALGGHSLLAVRVLSRVRQALGADLPLRTLFAAPTIHGLAQAIDALVKPLRAEESALPPLVRLAQPGLAPLSFPQQRLWFMDRLQPGLAIYNEPVSVRLGGPLDPAALERSLGGVVRRHEALRTRFTEVDGQPWQEVLPPEPFLLPEADLRALPRDLRAGELARLGREEALRPFDLSRAPLLRAHLVRLEREEHALLFTLHHIVSDAWSDEILGREISALYAGEALPELHIQYADYTRWQRSWPEAYLAAQLDYWKRQLDGLAALELPTDRPRPPVQTFRGGVVHFTVPEGVASTLRDLARHRGATLFMALLAAWQAVLARLAGQTDVAVGMPVANRGHAGIEGLIGFFVNMLALRTDLSGDPTFEEMLARVRRTSLDAYTHQELPFERIVDELRPERDLSRQPLVQVMIAFQEAPTVPLDLPGVEAAPLDLTLPLAKFDLTLWLAGQERGLSALLEFSADLFDRATVQRIAGHLLHVLEQATARPAARLSEIGLLTPAERHQAVREWNDTEAPFTEETLVHQFFEAQADRRPGALAALWKGERITYGGLEDRANRIAHLLREINAGPVGVWMERSLDMIAAVLGVLKAGGTYLPCDAAWPADRVEAILAATGAAAVLTRAALLPAVEEMQWRLPGLDHAVCLDLPEPEPPPEALDAEAVRGLFDHLAESAVDRITAGGFVSSLTGLPFSEAEVDEYRDRVLALAGPWLRPGARVLEIGNGSGLLLWEMVAWGCRCVGLDPSPLTQERNREHARRHGLQVELRTGFAHEIGELEGSFDIVLLASTVQFFPGRRYLQSVLKEALAKLAPGGAVLVADVPDARHERGKVLSLDEEWFHGLPAEAEVLRRSEGFDNELRFRYDVVLREGKGRAARKRLWTAWHVERYSADRLPALSSPESVAYVIHTSGSTGQPKGIAVQHRPVANLIQWLNPAFGVGPEDRVLFVTSLAFDLSVWDIFGVLAAGGSIHVASEEDLRDPEELLRALHRVTIWDSAPAALVQLAPLFPSVPGKDSRLRLVMLSGDWIPVTLPDRVRSAFPAARVMSLGGATEATVWSNWYPVAEVDPRWPSIPYGRPIANARYHVVDSAFEPCPIGVPGDLHIGGGCLCVGYAGQPDLTAAAFLPDPFSAEPGARLYRTGDRARAFPDGNLEFLGRADQQVKIRGFRIELGEIEATLARHPEVREAAVVVHEGRLVAYVVSSNPSDLVAHLRRTLPDYMIPSAFVTLDELPVTPNGKLDRRALPAPHREGSDDAVADVPRGPAEERLLAIWREILGIERIGVHDSFFDLGGHSLLATQLMARLRESFGIEVHLRTLFQTPTIAGLAAALDGAAAVSAEPPLVPVRREGDLPLSASQLRQWFLMQLDPGDPAYTLPLSLDLEGRLDFPALEGALAEIVRRHEVLRTAFPSKEGRPVAVVVPSSISLPHVDLSALPEPLKEASRLEAEDRPFDLARGPLLRLALLRLGEEKHRLLLTVHHIVFDGWSFGVFTRELAALYGGTPLAEPALQYADYAAWQREWLAGPAAEAQVESWKSRLGGVSRTLALPTDRPRPAVQSSRGESIDLELPADLRAFAAREGVTLFMAGLAAWSALLARHADQDDFSVGTFVANRRREALEHLLGLFVNTLALPVDLAGDPDFRGLLARVRESTLEAFEHQELPFERLLEALDPERDLSRTPLFQVLFGVQNFALPCCEARGLTFRSITAAETDHIAGDLALWIWEEGDGIAGWIKYATDLFDRTTAVRLSRQLLTLLAAAMADPGARLSDLPLLTGGERHQLLSEWGTAAPAQAPEDLLTVPERIAIQAARTPDAPAVEMGDEWLTYAELVDRADGLAAELRRRGAGPEMVVGIAMERSPDQIVALLGILRAGAAYLPLDPALPPARLARLVEESGARLAVASPSGAARLSELPVDMLVLSKSPPLPGRERGPGGEGPDLHNMAYVLYTSGSTGTPKGVMVEHASLSRFITTCLDLYGFAPGDRVLQFAPLSFDISVEEIFACLTSGATLVLRDDEMIASPAHFLARCRDLGITVLDLPAAYGHELAPALAAGVPLPSALRLLITGGEKILPGPMGDWLAAGGDRLTVLDTYGPTENTVVASVCKLRDSAELTIGRPIRGVQVWILDREMRPVPPGVPGEVYLGGAGLARGYLNRPDLTAERFVPAPEGERLYRTGDLARWLPDGRLDFAGRADDQVKIRGFRIEPGEIAAVLSSHPEVREAAVVARGARLAAYVTGSVEPAGLRAWLKDRLPAYMVPPDIVLLEALPLTPSGKVDRRALPEPEGPSRPFALPTSPTEELLAAIWNQLLGIEQVGLYDDFFDLGGHSLLAPQLLARIQDAFQVDLPLRVLFEASTVAQMSAILEDALLAQIEELSEEEAASLLEA
jgi:amino acid adenylation domain-containing protein